MTNKTDGVKDLVQEVLHTLREPYGEDIILNVFQKIEHNVNWYNHYKDLGEELKIRVVNNWIGKFTKSLTGMKILRRVQLKEKHLVTTYTKLSR
jgi:hypothetical protein